MMQRGHGHNGVERPFIERGGEDVTVNPLDSRALVLGTCTVEHRSIDIEPDDIGHAGGREFRGQHPVATSNVQNA